MISSDATTLEARVAAWLETNPVFQVDGLRETFKTESEAATAAVTQSRLLRRSISIRRNGVVIDVKRF